MSDKKRIKDLERKLADLSWNIDKMVENMRKIDRKANGLHIMDLNVEPEPVEQEKDLSEAKAFLYSVWHSAGTTREAIIPTIVKCSLKAAYWMKTFSITTSKLHGMLESLTEQDMENIEEELIQMNEKNK